ncbi:MAG: AAA family ATPase [Rhodospirillaceae bacterium]
MNGIEFKEIRQRIGIDQFAMSTTLNEKLNRRYDVPRISRWENGTEKIPTNVSTVVRTLGMAKPDPARPCITISICNQKGGVGKTTSTVNLAYALSIMGAKVLVVDADGQGNLTEAFGGRDESSAEDIVARERSGLTMYHVIRQSATLKEIIIPTTYPGIDLAPASPSLARADEEIRSDAINGVYRISDAIKTVRDNYDVILIDCGPSLGSTIAAVLMAADGALIPIQVEHWAIMGVGLILETIKTVQLRRHTDLKVIGLLPTMYNGQLLGHKTMLSDLEAGFGSEYRVWGPIPRAAMYSTAQAGRVPALAADPAIRGGEVYRDIAAAILTHNFD